MKSIIRHRFMILVSLMLPTVNAFATPINNTEQTTEHAITQLYHSLQTNPTTNMVTRLNRISKQWLQQPYILTALGEGHPSPYDEGPRYRLDGFDCETYVDTVLAAALANNVISFKQCMDHIRYKEGHVSYLTRNHFTSLDWNINNQRQGFIQDITNTIMNDANQPVAKPAQTLIDKAAWYAHASLEKIRLPGASLAQKTQQLARLKQAGSTFKTQVDTIDYIPLTTLFNKQGQAVMSLFNQIPDGAIIEIIRPNWDLTTQIGTHLNVSHLGFVFKENGTLFFRQASSNHQKVLDVPLIDYLREAQKSPTIGGINIQIVVPKAPLADGCGHITQPQ